MSNGVVQHQWHAWDTMLNYVEHAEKAALWLETVGIAKR